MPGTGDLKSWTNYVQRPFPPIPCPGRRARHRERRRGADRRRRAIRPPLRDRLERRARRTARRRSRSPGRGHVPDARPRHRGVDRRSSDRDRRRRPDRGRCTPTAGPSRAHGRRRVHHAREAYTGEPVLTLDLTGITPVTTRRRDALGERAGEDRAGRRRWIGGGTYPAGSRWGTFTIAVAGAMRRWAGALLALALLRRRAAHAATYRLADAPHGARPRARRPRRDACAPPARRRAAAGGSRSRSRPGTAGAARSGALRLRARRRS